MEEAHSSGKEKSGEGCGCFLVKVALSAALIYGIIAYKNREKLDKGIPVKPAAVADFNNDGRGDIVRVSYEVRTRRIKVYAPVSREESEDYDISVIDGKHVEISGTDRGIVSLIHDEGRKVGSFSRDADYSIVPLDINGDGNLDFMVELEFNSGPPYHERKRERRVYIGDGNLNFVKKNE